MSAPTMLRLPFDLPPEPEPLGDPEERVSSRPQAAALLAIAAAVPFVPVLTTGGPTGFEEQQLVGGGVRQVLYVNVQTWEALVRRKLLVPPQGTVVPPRVTAAGMREVVNVARRHHHGLS